MAEDRRRALPSVDALLQREDARVLEARHGRALVLAELRRILDEARAGLSAGQTTAPEAAAIVAELAVGVARASAPSLVRVINATGVVVHTNLGRAPLPAEAARRVAAVASAYCNLEFDLVRGERGDRESHAETRLRDLLGAEAAVVVNNNAAAILLAVNTLAEGREVVVSRGELVEIGGSFRIPEILRKGGARLVEVGSTNRTRLADYRAALSPHTAMILKVHPSNFRVVGFTETTPAEALAGLAHEAGLPLVEDQGSGYLRVVHERLTGEATLADSLAAGVDVVAASGDKLLGGPQAGLVLGRQRLVDAMRRNPLYRALRVDKMTIAALDSVLAEHQAGRAGERVPVLAMLAASRDEVRARAQALARALKVTAPTLAVEVVDGQSAVGGGAAPTVEIPTALLALRHTTRTADSMARDLRSGEPPIVVRILDERVVADLRTVSPEDEPALLDALARVAGRG
jgi:L-seryl-tRNA(Ser) seleniumtransferase